MSPDDTLSDMLDEALFGNRVAAADSAANSQHDTGDQQQAQTVPATVSDQPAPPLAAAADTPPRPGVQLNRAAAEDMDAALSQASAVLAAFKRSIRDLLSAEAEAHARRVDLVRVREELRSSLPMKRARVERAQADLQGDLDMLKEMDTIE